MKSLGIVFIFELKTYLRKKAFIISTVLLLLIALLGTSIPTLINVFTGGKGVGGDFGSKQKLVYYTSDKELSDAYSKQSEENPPKAYNSLEDLKKGVESGEIDKGFYMQSDRSFTSIMIDQSFNDPSDMMMTEFLKTYIRNKSLVEKGIDPQWIEALTQVEITQENEVLGKSARSSFATVYAAMISIYMMVILYGSIVATSVAREKSDRTMELLITSTSTKSLIVGKVLAATVVSILQIFAIYLVTYIGLRLNEGSYPEGFLQAIGLTITWDGALVLLVFGGLGYLMYLFLFASLGALVSKVEDVNTSVSPVTFVFVAVYLLTNFSINMPESFIAKLASIIPVSSPMAMFARYSMVSIPIAEMALAVVLLVVTVIAMAFLSIKIYRLGSLNYGNRMGLIKAIRLMMQKD